MWAECLYEASVMDALLRASAGGVSNRTESMSMCWVRSGWGQGHDGRVELRRSREEGLAMPLQAVLTAFSRAAEIMHRYICKETVKRLSCHSFPEGHLDG